MEDRLSERARLIVGVVVIGRNEGARLEKCLESVAGSRSRIVYVDSGSTDGSVAMARAMGADVIELDSAIPFTAARARNEGFRRLRELAPRAAYVQFIDGDCELVRDWLVKCVAFLDAHREVAAVCGRLRERHPERSIYNMLCDMEWDTRTGEIRSCGGIAMMRAEAFAAAGGFRADVVAGEEPELCIRLRAAGWRVWRLESEMALHDAAMLRFGQWWKRSVRTGYGYAQGVFLHGASPELHWVKESRRAWAWGLGLPVLGLACTLLAGPAGAVVLFLFPLQVARLALRGNRSRRENWWRAAFLVLGKFPEALGQLKYLWESRSGRALKLIEYK